MGRKRIVIEVSGTANTVTGDMLVIGRLGCRSELVGTVVRVEDVPPPEEEKVTGLLYDPGMMARLRGCAFLAGLLTEKVIEAGDKTPLKIATAFGDVVVTLDVHQKRKPNPSTPEPLKPCPFCGGEARVIDRFPESGWYQCGECHVTGPCENSEPKARAAWNRRTP